MRITILTSTYNRPKMLEKLIDQVKIERTKHDINWLIYNDFSTEKYDIKFPKFVSYYDIAQRRNGKEEYWRTVNFLIQKAPRASYYFFLPDDITIVPGFFDKALSIWNEINDKRKIALSFYLLKSRIGKRCWTRFSPYLKGNIWHTQWVDMCFMCTDQFFKHIPRISPIDPNRWRENKLLGSGVGQQLSLRLHKKMLNMYHAAEILAFHSGHDSMMNPEERKITTGK